MGQKIHPKDERIVQLLQQQGLIKREVKTRLKSEVYRLQTDEIVKINNYAEHFGLSAKQKLIDEILDLRRETMISRLTKAQVVAL
ncbi:hypothetical protein [Vibrio japonicus]|uniref:Uncharacterized protein n=1 Tax=Vibrio japonicus TaxID=1824638 RepID=A0ABY5LF48_9VIBR|nr:hypothetical protein [Vibrio japonicus]UUM29565.1 hypothetical protein NP165_07490 [Vibrio japonicus]